MLVFLRLAVPCAITAESFVVRRTMPHHSVAPAGAHSLAGKHCVVTGANSGLGYATASALLSRGASVVLACRRPDAAEAAARSLRLAHPGASVSTAELDLTSLSSVGRFATTYVASGVPLHCLCNNAGCNFWDKPPAAPSTADGYGVCAQANFLGAACLTLLLAPALLRAAPSRVVFVGSATHRSGSLRAGGTARFLCSWKHGQYGDAKLAGVAFSFEADRRLRPRGVRYVSVDPGAVQSNIWAGTPLGGPRVAALMDRLYAPCDDGSQAIVHACAASLDEARGPSPGGGELYFARGLFARGPVTWDSWLPQPVWSVCALAASLADWPARGLLGGATRAVAASPMALDRRLGEELWGAAAAAVGLAPDAI